MSYEEALYAIKDMKQVLTEAILLYSNVHESWHALPSSYQQQHLGSLQHNIWLVLIPSVETNPKWAHLSTDLYKIVKYLSAIEEGPKYGCPRCV